MPTFRIWPDYTIQDVDDVEPYDWKSDDFTLIEAEDEETALEIYKKVCG